jgi:hypothetical protein
MNILLCLRITNIKGTAILIENNLTTGAFTPERMAVLNLLCFRTANRSFRFLLSHAIAPSNTCIRHDFRVESLFRGFTFKNR